MVIKKLKDFGFNTDNRTYIIAEIGINHRGDINIAKQLIDSAVRSGVDAVKFQTYITEQRAPKGNDEVFKILKDLELSFEAFKELKEYAKQYDVDFFSTPFDNERVLSNLYKTLELININKNLYSIVKRNNEPNNNELNVKIQEKTSLPIEKITYKREISNIPPPLEEEILF